MPNFSNDDHAAPKWLQAGYVGAIFMVMSLNTLDKFSSDETQPYTRAWVSSALTNSWEFTTGWLPEDDASLKTLIASFPKLRTGTPSQP